MRSRDARLEPINDVSFFFYPSSTVGIQMVSQATFCGAFRTASRSFSRLFTHSALLVLPSSCQATFCGAFRTATRSFRASAVFTSRSSSCQDSFFASSLPLFLSSSFLLFFLFFCSRSFFFQAQPAPVHPTVFFPSSFSPFFRHASWIHPFVFGGFSS